MQRKVGLDGGCLFGSVGGRDTVSFPLRRRHRAPSHFSMLSCLPPHPLLHLQPGTEMVAAGYCMYGSMSYMMITTGKGVAGFTLDPTLGECSCGAGRGGPWAPWWAR